MSKRNYSQYSKKNNDEVQAAVEAEATVTPAVVEPTPEIDAVPEVVETVVAETEVKTEVQPEKKTKKSNPAHKSATGTVVNCAKLNVRAEASTAASPVCVLDVASEVEVNVEKSTKDWVSVRTATGIEGYCMRKFINVNL